jgi:hypothetical protein
MTFKHYLFLILSVYTNIGKAQDVKIHVKATGNDAFVSAMYFPENNITVCISKQGNIVAAFQGNNFNRSMDDDENTSDHNNFHNSFPSVRPFEDLSVTYYGSSEWDELQGKVKSVGDLPVTYYDRFGWDELKGKLKSIGKFNITYYDRFGWDELKGKMKTIGNTSFTYYDRFGAGYKLGRIKNIDGKTDDLNVLWPRNQYSDF